MDDEAYPVELTAPSLDPYKHGNTGTNYVTTFDSGKPGPHAMVNALTHGNEICGAIAVDFLFREGVRPTRGKLTLAFANVAAYRSFDPNKPAASRFVDEDFNRVWSESVLDGPRKSSEMTRARQLRPLIDTVDFLLDIHSMQHRTPPLGLSGPLKKGQDFALGVGGPEIVVADQGHAAGKRLRDYSFFGKETDSRNAYLVECGQHWEKTSADVAIDCTLRFLKHVDIVSPDFLDRHLPKAPPKKQRVIQVTEAVTVASDDFRFVGPYRGMEEFERKGTEIANDGGKPVLTPYDGCVLIMPSRRLRKGLTAVRLGRYIA
ncbi:MAG: succinylglutamate desuccinylase [Alphaproteobacteria bacterium]|nr:succinylglutamate desuccinylase [Alphaproteobacteria bacterium]